MADNLARLVEVIRLVADKEPEVGYIMWERVKAKWVICTISPNLRKKYRKLPMTHADMMLKADGWILQWTD